MTPPSAAALRPFAALWFAYFATLGLYGTYAPLWFQDAGLTTLAIGSIASLQAWTRVVAPYGWSWWADHRAARVALIRRATLGALAGASALGVLAACAAGWLGDGARAAVASPVARIDAVWVMAAVALMFVANGGVVPLAESALSQHLVQREGSVDAARYGRVRLWGSLGFVAALAVGGPLLQRVGVAAFPLLVVALSVALVLAAHGVPQVDEPHLRAGDATRAPAAWPALKVPAVAWFFASVFATVLAHVALYTFLSLYLDGIGHGKAAVGLLWIVGVVVEVGFFFLQGRFFHAVSLHGWLQVAAAATVLRFTATALGGHLTGVLVAAQALHALTFAAHHAACIGLLGRYFPGRLRSRGQALYSALGYGLSGVVGGVGGGWIVTHAGYQALFAAAAGCGVVAWACARQSARCDAAAGSRAS